MIFAKLFCIYITLASVQGLKSLSNNHNSLSSRNQVNHMNEDCFPTLFKSAKGNCQISITSCPNLNVKSCAQC
jgi:hypothetical protein